MPAAFPQSKHPLVPLRDLILGSDVTRHVMMSGPVEPRLNRTTGKVYGSQALQSEGTPNVALISFGDLKRDGSIDDRLTPTVAYSPEVHEYVVRPGDILLRGRGYVGSEKVAVAAYVDRATHDEALRALRKEHREVHFAYNSSLLRIRLQDGVLNDAPKLDPEYLAAYINTPQAQRYLTKHNQGGLVSGISKSDFLGMPVVLPSLAEQKQLVELIRIQAEYARVSSRLSECYAVLANHVFSHS